jgi:cytoskeleton protein RodZ
MMQNAGVSVGALLRSRREELGQDTETVSRQLRIRAIYLRAIEEGRIQDLPGATYAVGFVRSYADFLGFDGNSVVSSFRDELGQRGRAEPVSWQIEDRDGGFPFGKILVVLLVIAAAGYGLWYYLANTQSGSGLIEAVPEYLKKSTGTDKPASTATGETPSGEAPAGQAAAGQSGNGAQPVGGTSGEGQASTAAATPAASQNAATDNQAAGANAAAPSQGTSGDQEAENKANGQVNPAPATTAPVTTAPAANPPAAAAAAPTAQPSTTTPASVPAAPGQANATPAADQPANGQPAQAATATGQAATGTEAAPDVAAAASSPTTRVSIHAKLESWVQITDKDGKPVLSRVLRAGETYAVPDEKGLTMNTGNAGGIDLLVDGKALPSLGSVGLVKRNILLDADKLASGNVTVEQPAKKPGSGDAAPVAPAGD